MKNSIPSIFYRGPENYVSVISASRVNYTFSRDTDYTVSPESWEDFYEILLLDKFNVRGRLYVVSTDPTSETNLRRVSPEEYVVPEELIEAQNVINDESAKKTELLGLKNKYIAGINLQIAHGTLDSIPENLDEDAEKYAIEQYEALHNPVVVEVPVGDVVVDTTLEAPVTDVVLDTDPVLDPPETPAPTDVVPSEAPETPVETAPVETPVVETPEVVENKSDESTDPVTQPPADTPTEDPVAPETETPPSEEPVTTEAPETSEPKADVEPTEPVATGPKTSPRSRGKSS